MSRSGYSDDCDDILAHGRWRAQVKNATNSLRGQALLRDLIDELESMPVKRLIMNEFSINDEVCSLGAVARRRGTNLEGLDVGAPEWSEIDPKKLGQRLNCAPQLAQEIMYINDELLADCTPEQRHAEVLTLIKKKIRPA